MRTVYYVTGPSGSGKTTAARRLAKRMDLPLYHADFVYQYLQEEHGIPAPARDVINYRNWDDPAKLGIESWDPFSSMEEAKAPMFDRLLDAEGGDFIIEGFTLSFRSERRQVERVIGSHRAVLLRIDVPFDVWESFKKSKPHGANVHPRPEALERLRNCFEADSSERVFTFTDPTLINQPLNNYQKPDFIERKIAALKLPVQAGDVVNDIGCNAGEIGKWCLDQGASEVHGYERNWRFLDQAADKGLVPHLGDVDSMEITPADLIFCVSTFHYFQNPQLFLQKVSRAARRHFVLELPLFVGPERNVAVQRFAERHMISQYHAKNRHTKYSRPLIEHWLGEHFTEVECVGESVAPDTSYRLVYHCKP